MKSSQRDFYDRMYLKGYMVDWPLFQIKRIGEIIDQIDLPDKGIAIDYGCGNGILTSVLKTKLPSWEVYGCDISQVSIENASKDFPECSFFVLGDSSQIEADFLFSHHVLEHVYDLEEALVEIDSFMKAVSKMLHIFPCGNKGSLEFKIASMVKNGIDVDMGNRFHFEEESHLRRIRSNEFIYKVSELGFQSITAFFSNHFVGSIRYYSQSNLKQIILLTQYKNSLKVEWSIKLVLLRFFLVSLFFAQLPFRIFKKVSKQRNVTVNLLFIPFSPIIILSFVAKALVDYFADLEWRKKRDSTSGSESFLVFERSRS